MNLKENYIIYICIKYMYTQEKFLTNNFKTARQKTVKLSEKIKEDLNKWRAISY